MFSTLDDKSHDRDESEAVRDRFTVFYRVFNSIRCKKLQDQLEFSTDHVVWKDIFVAFYQQNNP